MAEHTSGRLSYRTGEFDDWGFVRDDQGHLVAVVKPGTSLSPDEENRNRADGTDPAEANARRFVACWNACRGIQTASLEIAADMEYSIFRLQSLAALSAGAALAIHETLQVADGLEESADVPT